MLIEKVDVFPLRWEYPSPIADARSKIKAKSALIVRIWSSDGTWGWGEAATFGDIPELVATIIKDKIAPLIIGKKVEPKRIPEFLFSLTAHYGQKGLMISAISGIEIALWDLFCKNKSISIASLFGAGISPIKAYASTGYYRSESDASDDLRWLKEDLMKINLNDFSGIKIKIGKYGIQDDINRVKITREIIGSKHILIVDANNALTVRQAIDLSYSIRDYNVLFMEEPIPFGNPQESRRLRDQSRVAIGGYELEFRYEGYSQYIKYSAVDYLQPDCVWSGGIFECLLIAEQAKRNLIQIVPHNFSTVIALAANLNLLSISGAGTLIEYDKTGNPFIEGISEQKLLPQNGVIQINELTGLGIEIDLEKIKQYLV